MVILTAQYPFTLMRMVYSVVNSVMGFCQATSCPWHTACSWDNLLFCNFRPRCI